MERSDSWPIRTACWVRNCTISGEARICDTVRRVARLDQGRDALVGRLLLREVGLGGDELVGDRADLLVGERGAVGGFGEIVVGLVFLHRRFLRLELGGEIVRAPDEPVGRPGADGAF